MNTTVKSSKKLHQLNIGEEITHWVYGHKVKGKIINTGPNWVQTEHEPIQWGRDTITQTFIHESTELQKKWGGTDKNGNPAPGMQTTPGAWYNDLPITI